MGSANPEHIDSSDQSAVWTFKKQMTVMNAKAGQLLMSNFI